MKKIHYTDNYLLKPYHPVTVFIIGAGGTGSQVVTNLARMNAALQASGHPGLHVKEIISNFLEVGFVELLKNKLCILLIVEKI